MNKKLNIPKTFFGFLTASILFWLLMNLSKEYTTAINFSVNYTNLPVKKTIIDTPVKKINLLVKGTGFKLIANNFSNNSIALDLEKVNKKRAINYYFLTKNLNSIIQNQLKSGLKLISIEKDTIPLKIGTLSSKKVPLKSNLNVNFQLGYDFSKPLIIRPDSVLISGEKSSLEKIHYLNLKQTDLNSISESKTVTSEIIFPKNNKIKADFTTAEIDIFVDKFTEGEVIVPIIIKNAPKGITIFPKEAKIIFKVALNNFNKINANLFKIECDYNQIIDKDVNYLIPKLITSTDLITATRISPNKIDFLIHK